MKCELREKWRKVERESRKNGSSSIEQFVGRAHELLAIVKWIYDFSMCSTIAVIVSKLNLKNFFIRSEILSQAISKRARVIYDQTSPDLTDDFIYYFISPILFTITALNLARASDVCESPTQLRTAARRVPRMRINLTSTLWKTPSHRNLDVSRRSKKKTRFKIRWWRIFYNYK